MSDLFCPATVVLARHGEAEYEEPFVADAGGSLTACGRDQGLALGESLRSRRVAAVVSSDMSRAVQTAEIAAGVLGLPVRVRRGLREFSLGDLAGETFPDDGLEPVYQAWRSGDLGVGCPGAETGADVLSRMSAELESLVDQFRGETVLVVSHGGAIGLSVPRLVKNVADDFAWSRQLQPGATCELSADADGWVLHTWGGERVG